MQSSFETFRVPSLSTTFKQFFFKFLVLLGCMLVLTGNARAGVLYVLNQQSGAANQIYCYSVNESTGALTLLPGFPVSSGGNGAASTGTDQITIDRINRRLYVINDGSNTVSAFTIDSGTGGLTPLPFSPIPLPAGTWFTVAVHPSGSPLIVGSGNSTPTVASFIITATTATAAAGSPYSTGTARPGSSAFSRDGNFVYLGGSVTNTFAGFSVNSSTGILTALPGSPFDSGAASPNAYAMDSQGRLFLANTQSNSLRAFTTPSGIPTVVTGNPFTSGITSATDGVLNPSERFYYVADQGLGRVGGFQISGTGAATTLTALAGFPVSSGGSQTMSLAFNVNGAFLFAVNNATRNISTYSVSISNGALTFGNVQAVDTLGATGSITGMAYQPTTFTVTNTNDSGPGSLRQAVLDANAAGGGLITFDPTFFGTLRTITLATGQVVISTNITIAGTGADLLIVQNTAAASSTSRVFLMNDGSVTLSGMTITGGNLSSTSGAGITINSTFNRVTLSHCAVSGNNTANGIGGGILNTGTLSIINSTISNNTANNIGNGGGGIDSEGPLFVTNSTISGNSKTGGGASSGGIYTDGAATTITNSTITNNSTTGGSGGVHGTGGTVRNTIIAGNQNNATIPDVTGTFAPTGGGFNLIGNVGTATGFNQTGDQTGTGAAVLSPQLAALALNGGPIPTHRLLTVSPALDKGHSSNISNDQRGFARRFDHPAITNPGDGADIGAFEKQAVNYEFDGDGKADISVFRPSNGGWFLLRSSAGFTAVFFGQTGDRIVPADYDGDGFTDVAVFRSGTWFLQRSQLGFVGVGFGAAGDIPQPADIDGDGKAELVVFRPSNGMWFVLNLVNNQFSFVPFGQNGDHPVIADYDADGRADFAVYRPSIGTWFMLRSTKGFIGVQFGDSTDKPVVGDYDGDGKADLAVYRPSQGTWYLLRSTQGFTGIQFGISTDLPSPADFDGDGKTDIAVFRNGVWFLLNSTTGFASVQFGTTNDKPIPNAFVP